MTTPRLRFAVVAMSTIAVGLLVHLHGAWLGAALRDVLGDALWAMMIAWWIGAAAPHARVAIRSGVAYVICVSVELSQLCHTPALDAVRATRLGHLVLGSGFDPRDLVSYLGGVAIAALLEIAANVRRGGGSTREQGHPGYPAGYDAEWLAVDRYGRLGIFTTGGSGPVPRAYLDAPRSLERISAWVWSCPERTASTLLVRLPRPDDFEAFARRGFFAFDWADVHRTSGFSRRYELQARPAEPVTTADVTWPRELSALIQALSGDTLDFDQSSVDVSLFDCRRAP